MKAIYKIIVVTVVLYSTSQLSYALDIGKMSNIAGSGMDTIKAITLSDSDVKSMASLAKKKSDKINPLAPSNDILSKRLVKITDKMKVDKGLDLDIKVYLVKDVNAFAMADGTIRIFAGLMKEMTDDEIRYVIGHEIGHVKLGHSKSSLQRAYATSAARKAAAASGNSVAQTLSTSEIGELTEKLIHAQYSQSDELAADSYAIQFMKKNKYDPKAAVTALRKLEALYGNESSLFSSHPAPGERAATLEKTL
jgi:metalloprotease